MKKLYLLMLCALPCSFLSHAQISVTGNSTAISTPVNALAVVVDNSLTITSSVSFDGAKVSVSNNFNTGDILSYTGTLPTGVTGSYNSTTGVLTFMGTATALQYQALLQTVSFQTSSTVALQRTILFNLGSAVANPANGHLYEFVPGSFSWISAKTAAAGRSLYGMQGYLATITSAVENNFITQKLGADGWIGSSDDYTQINGGTTYANQSLSEGKWYWITGPEAGTQFSNGNTTPTQLTYMNWNASEPNNTGSNEHYGEIFASTSVGKWNDLPNSSLLGYVVEYGGMAGDPSVDVIHSRPITLIATSLRTSGVNNSYNLQAAPITVDNSLTLYSSTNITNATITVSSGFKAGDVLSYTAGSLPGGVTGSYNATTGVLSFAGTATPSAWQALLKTVQFNSTSYIIGNRSISFSVGNLISGSNGHFYEFVATGANWTTAKANASAKMYLGLQGYLATITSQTENDFVQQKLSSDGWIGASDEFSQINATGTATYADQTASEGKWYWVTGPEAGTQMTTGNAPNGTSLPPVFGSAYNNWNIGEPNNSPNEHYAEFYFSGAAPGKWNDLGASASLGYVVEYGGLSTDPLLELSANKTIVISSVLPVNGLTFSVVKKNESAVLSWSTESEEKTIRFEVMHSLDGRNFTRLADVMATGSTTSKTNYGYTHDALQPGTNYYKLRIVDRDGKATETLIKTVTVKGRFTIGPNPATAYVNVTNPFSTPATLLIKNSIGALIRKKTISPGQTNVDIQTLPAGIYFAQVAEGENASDVVRIIKN